MKNIKIGNKFVGDNNPCLFIAEIGNLFKNFEQAKILIDSAIEIGVDAIKFQTFEAETLTTKKNNFDMEVTGDVSQYEFLKELEISKELQTAIVKYAKEKRIIIRPAAILSSLPKKINILPIKDAAIPKDIKTTEKPSEKTIVLSKTTLLFFSISSNFFPVI